ncbi:MAG TPA: methyltransferase domain-containing protein [Candidatus Sulfotelmatobacter sp.]|jgi:ubiquinone/menaquinone biosynthesis C-methylase UbiE|nr:methyltransferase domain-containing protein [Candidatus Sulfotelmatobacter sp.]
MVDELISDVRSCYDLVADEYARRIYDELQHKPLDRQMLDRFAKSVGNAGLVCDLGCGPGQVARYMHEQGLQVCGVDLSQGMIERARQLNPGIEFSTDDMRALSAKDGAWAGIAAFYAIVNLSPRDLAQALRGMMRVLLPGGRLLLSFHIGEDTTQVEDMWNYGTALEFTFYRVCTVAGHVRDAGFEIEEIVERAPYAPDVEYQSHRAYIFAQKPRTKNASA